MFYAFENVPVMFQWLSRMENRGHDTCAHQTPARGAANPFFATSQGTSCGGDLLGRLGPEAP